MCLQWSAVPCSDEGLRGAILTGFRGLSAAEEGKTQERFQPEGDVLVDGGIARVVVTLAFCFESMRALAKPGEIAPKLPGQNRDGRSLAGCFSRVGKDGMLSGWPAEFGWR